MGECGEGGNFFFLSYFLDRWIGMNYSQRGLVDTQ